MPQKNTVDFCRDVIGDAITAATGSLDGAKIHLLGVPTVFDNRPTFADITAAAPTYTGYAAVVTGAWGLVGTDSADVTTVTALEQEFQPGGAVPGAQVSGYAICDGAGTKVYSIVQHEPVDMSNALCIYRAVPTITLPAGIVVP